MKFNSVEISGFRIYNNSKDAKFSFVTDEGETADFVSLFAPNGFGKTSFYDAVEWAVTDNIERFWVNSKSTKKSLSMLRQLNPKQIKLLKNHNTTNETWVKIKDSNNVEYRNRVLNIPGQRAFDINKSDSERDDIEFLKVILSQEWISRFLKEADGQLRYKKFMESNSGLQEIDVYYQSVIALSKANDKNILSIQDEIKEFESKIRETSEEDLLTTINDQIAKLNELTSEKNLDKIEVTTTKKEIADLRNRLSDIIAGNPRINQTKKLISHIQDAINGNDNLFSQKQYFEALKNLSNVEKTNKEIKANLEGFEKLKSTENEINQKESSRGSKSVELRDILALQLLMPRYDEILQQIVAKNETKSKKQNALKNLQNDIEISNRKLIEEEDNNKKSERLRLEMSQDLENIPKLKKDLNALLKSISKLKIKIETQRTKTNNSLKLFTQHQDRVDELIKVKQELEVGQYSETSLEGNSKQIQNLKELEKLEVIELRIRKDLKGINVKIQNQESLNKSLNDFISSGLAIVNKQETNICPLCEQSYDNYSTLADKIMNNDALSASIKDLLQQRTDKQLEIGRNGESKTEFIEKIQNFYTNQLNELQDKLKLVAESKDDNEKLLDSFTKSLSAKNANLLDFKSKFKQDTLEKYEENLKKGLSEILATKKTDEGIIEKTKSAHQKLLSEQSKIEETLKLLDQEIEKLEADKIYSEVSNFVLNNQEEGTDIPKLIDTKVTIQQTELNLFDEQLKALKEILKPLNEKLKKLNEQQLKDKLKETDSTLKSLESRIQIYNSHLNEYLSIEPLNFIDSELTESISRMEQDAKNKLKQYENHIIEVKKLMGYSENILPYLQSEQAKLEMSESKKELNFVTDKVGPLLYEEILKTRNHLDKKIKKFFYEDLINEIYGKIDPHPSFKQVKFIATFSDSSPSLDVYVKGGIDDNDEDSLIPNLYFSTAQINILSLSIFLASALNSKKYDCIFIDDPIQSMDSINVLSTIDLLRSIVVNNKKQIILSTHDENFHNLLKMKIPSELFKSKFLELESFGKLKQV